MQSCWFKSVRRNEIRPRLASLEDRIVPSFTTFGGDAQHTGVSAVASQPVEAIHWETVVDSDGVSNSAHYGAPLVTPANTIIHPLGTANTTPNQHVIGRNGNDGSLIWDVTTDWTPAPYSWYPPYQPVLSTASNRVYYPGRGGTIYYRTNPDSAIGTVGQLAFFGMANYTSNPAGYNSTVFVDTPLTADSSGNVFFGFRVTGANPSSLVSGIARIAANGTGTWVSATAAAGDASIGFVARNSAFALSNDQSTIYLGVRATSTSVYGELLGLNSTTLATQYNSGLLKDPRNGGTLNASISSNTTSSPMVAPDGRVFYGVMANPSNGSRGWMLQYSADLATRYTPGGFGWDTTASIVPLSMVPQYQAPVGTTYLVFTKYNNYYNLDTGGDGDGTHMIAVLDPNSTEVEFHPSSNGLLVMKRALYKIGPTIDTTYGAPAVREWCINHAAVDPATNSVIINSEDGKYYRWYLPTNTLTESLQLTPGQLQPYTMTVIGVDGQMYGMQDGMLFALGKTPSLSISDATVAAGGASATMTVSLDYPRMTPITVNYATADGSALSGLDYTTTSDTLTFDPGQMTKYITVPVNTALVAGASEDFFVNLSLANGANILDGQGEVTLLGHPPRVSSVVVNSAAAQRSRVTNIAVNFEQFVDYISSSFKLTRQNDGAEVNLIVTPATGPAGSATLTFAAGPTVEFGSLADGRFTLTVFAASVSAGGGQLDGNNNGVGGDNFVLVGDPSLNTLFRLYGDSDGNGTVNQTDFIAFRNAFNNGPSEVFDFDGDGQVGQGDFIQFRNRFNESV